MNYQKHYEQLIHKAINYPHDGYTERHHITPRCMGGDDSPDNVVQLSAKQHFVAHHLLFKIYGGSKLAHAWYSMCRVGRGQEDRLGNARMFERAKAARSKILSEESLGSGNHFFGKRHTAESRSKMSAIQKELRLWEDELKSIKLRYWNPKNAPKHRNTGARLDARG